MFAYLFLPSLLMMILFLLKKVDPYEVLIKFTPVFSLMISEFILISVFLIFGMNESLLKNRITLYFLHVYYYIPVLYFSLAPANRDIIGPNRIIFSSKIRFFLDRFFQEYSKYYLTCFLFFIFTVTILFSFAGNNKWAEDISSNKENSFSSIVSKYTYDGSSIPVFVSDKPMDNLSLTIDNNNTVSSLWVNRFANKISVEDVISRLATYAKIYSWSLQQFICFMSYGLLQDDVYMNFQINQSNYLNDGIGYWMVYGDTNLPPDEYKKYIDLASLIYLKTSRSEGIKKYNVKLISYQGKILMP